RGCDGCTRAGRSHTPHIVTYSARTRCRRRGGARRLHFSPVSPADCRAHHRSTGGTMADRKDLHREGIRNRVEGAAEELEGKVRGSVGDALDNRDEHIKGRAKEMTAKIKRKFGELQHAVAERVRIRDRWRIPGSDT